MNDRSKAKPAVNSPEAFQQLALIDTRAILESARATLRDAAATKGVRVVSLSEMKEHADRGDGS